MRGQAEKICGDKYFWLLCAVLFLFMVTAAGALLGERAVATDFSRKNLTPCIPYLFGTDWMGCDMLARTLKGLSTSIFIGIRVRCQCAYGTFAWDGGGRAWRKVCGHGSYMAD